MKMLLRVAAVVAIMVLGIPAAIQAQTPSPQLQSKLTPQLTLTWLKSLTISPASVRAGNDATGTVTLLRPAIEEMRIGITITGGTQIEGGFWGLGGILVDGDVIVPAGSDRGTFWIKTSPTGGARTITIVARYAKETKSVSFAATK